MARKDTITIALVPAIPAILLIGRNIDRDSKIPPSDKPAHKSERPDDAGKAKAKAGEQAGQRAARQADVKAPAVRNLDDIKGKIPVAAKPSDGIAPSGENFNDMIGMKFTRPRHIISYMEEKGYVKEGVIGKNRPAKVLKKPIK
jgi:hypothetical protein